VVKQISPTVRVEEARRNNAAKATPALLASLAPRYVEGGRDAMGALIKAGQPMTYIDWNGPPVWRVYELRDGRYQIVAEHDTEAAAIKAAEKLAKG
jgi:hypothetical protein